MRAYALLLSLSLGACVIDEVREDDVGDAPACGAARLWPNDWGAQEDSLLDEINAVRAAGGTCGDRTKNPVPTSRSRLRCAALLAAMLWI